MSKLNVRKIQKQTAVQKVLESLKTYILSADGAAGLKLPSEVELADQLGVSRLTVREALTILEKEGYIARNQGSSTTITSFAKKLTCRIEDAREIAKFIEDSGYDSSVDEISYHWKESDQIESENLTIEIEEEILVVEKRFLADGVPAAFCVDRIPKRYFSTTDFKIEELEASIFYFVERYCGCQLTHDVIELIPIVSDTKLSRLFGVKEGSPLFRVDTIEYSKDGVPIMYNTEYYLPQFIRFTACRTVAYMI